MSENKKNAYKNYNIQIKNILKILVILFLICIIVLTIVCISISSKIKNIKTRNNETLSKQLIENSKEKYFNVKINENDIIKEYIDKIYSLVEKKDYQYLYLNIETSYLNKTNITVEQMTSKLEEISKNGININSYEKITLKDSDVYVCKLGANDMLLTIYEHKPGIYSFAFDGFVE